MSFVHKRHVAISGDGIDALIDGKVYTSRTDKKGDYVVDADTLCKYAALKIDADAVRSVAKEIAKKESHIDMLQDEIRALKIELDNVRISKDRIYSDKLITLNDEISKLSHSRDAWMEAAEGLATSCSEHWAKKIFSIPSTIFVELENIEGLSKVASENNSE